MDVFKKFINKETGIDTLPMKDLSEDIINKYIFYRKDERENGNETINKTLTPIIQAAQKAANNELLKPIIATALKGKYLNPKSKGYQDEDEEEKEEKNVKYLTEEQMQSFLNLYSTIKYKRTREFIDMFLFAFHACGLRVSDVLTLQWKNIDWEKKELKKTLVKGKVPHRIALTEIAMKILEKWQVKGYSERFVFAMLPDDFNLSDDKELYKKINSCNTTIKTSLKAVGTKIELPFNLTMHVARHTFAVMALNKRNVSLHIISKLLAHSSITVTEQVYAKFLPDTLDKEVKEKLSFDFLPQEF